VFRTNSGRRDLSFIVLEAQGVDAAWNSFQAATSAKLEQLETPFPRLTDADDR
jgi:hypothetical protein